MFGTVSRRRYKSSGYQLVLYLVHTAQDRWLLVVDGKRGRGKSSMSEISSAPDTHYEAENSLGGTDRSPTRSDSIRESSSSLTPCPLLGERPETSTRRQRFLIFWMKVAKILELASLYE